MAATVQTLQALDLQLNSHQTPLALRFRALFALKNVGNVDAINIIGKGFDGQSALLGHEMAYCLGQIKNPAALPILRRVLENEQEHPMVRHEAAEAMGAISDPSCLPVLERFLSHENVSIRETAEIAVAKIKWDKSTEGSAGLNNPFSTVDPAPASISSPLVSGDGSSAGSVEELQSILMTPTLPLFERYRAMFALRNEGSKKAILALATGFEDSSALFRHEIAYVFGQLSSPYSVPALCKVLRKADEEDMVRHEAAEALGSIATEECLPILKEFSTREGVPRVVRESCEVALDMVRVFFSDIVVREDIDNELDVQYAHEQSGDFQYASLSPTAVAAT